MNRSVRAAAVCVVGLIMSGEVMAVVGRPLTPVSVAGVARRTSRRTAYAYGGAPVAAPVAVGTAVAVGATVAALPPGCPYAATVYRCGGYAYRPVYDGPEVVYVVEDD